MLKLKRKKAPLLYPVGMAAMMREPSDLISREQVAQVVAALETNRRSVCFTGHRYLANRDLPGIVERLDRVLEQCYQHGYRDFLCGGALGFDMLAAERVAALQCRHGDARLIMVLPCSDQSHRWTERDAMRYERLLYGADDIQVLSPMYYEGCMQARNRHMVDRSSLCICYFRHPKGGTASTVAYAVKSRVPVLNVATENVDAAFPVE